MPPHTLTHGYQCTEVLRNRLVNWRPTTPGGIKEALRILVYYFYYATVRASAVGLPLLVSHF